MTEDRENLLARRQIVSALLLALENVDKLLDVCAKVQGGVAETQAAVAEAFDVGEIEANAILALQVRRFTPHSIEQIREELAEIDRRLSEETGA